MTVRRPGEDGAERVGRLILSHLDGLRATDALGILLDVARTLVRDGVRVEHEGALGVEVQQFGECLTTAEAADYLKARLRSFAPTRATLQTWAKPSRRRRYPHLDLPAPLERSRPLRWKRQDLDDWIDRLLAEKPVLSLNSADLRGDQGEGVWEGLEALAGYLEAAVAAGREHP